MLGFTSGKIPSIPANLPLLKNAAVVGSFLGGWRRRHPERFEHINQAIRAILAKTGMRTPIAHVFPMSEAAKALKLLVERKAIGAVALKP